jgi:hypothetical protein
MALTVLGGTDGGAMSTSRTGAPPIEPVGDDEIRSKVENDYDKEVYNGDLGVVSHIEGLDAPNRPLAG